MHLNLLLDTNCLSVRCEVHVTVQISAAPQGVFIQNA